MDWFQTEEQKNILGLYSFLFSHIYVLLFFCLKNVMKKYVFLFRKLRETLCSPYRTCQNDIKHRNKMKYTVLFLDIFLDIC